VFNLRGSIVPLIDICHDGRTAAGLLPKHVVVASLSAPGQHDVLALGIASDEVIGTYSVGPEDVLDRSPEAVPHCIGMLRHDDRLALILDLNRVLEVYQVRRFEIAGIGKLERSAELGWRKA